jgi:hypothetical protein
MSPDNKPDGMSVYRRPFMKTAGATASLLGIGLTAQTVGAQTGENTIRIESDGGGVAAYDIDVSGNLTKGEEAEPDEVYENRATGHLGPKRGTDTFNYTGEITGVSFAGPASMYVNGEQVDPDSYPAPPDGITSDDFSSGSGTNVIQVESDGGGVAAYEFTVNGDLTKGEEAEPNEVRGNKAIGRLGPEWGTDTFEYKGDITEFSLAGPASVYLNKNEVLPGSNGTDSEAPHSVSVEGLAASEGDAFFIVEMTGNGVDAEDFEGKAVTHIEVPDYMTINKMDWDGTVTDSAIEVAREEGGDLIPIVGQIDAAFKLWKAVEDEHNETPHYVTITPQGFQSSIELLVWMGSNVRNPAWKEEIEVYYTYTKKGESETEDSKELSFPG